MPRKEFTKKTKIAAWMRSGGKCEDCNHKFQVHETPEYDHIIEDYLNGGNDLDNCKVLCKKCHNAKTKDRRSEIDKTRRSFEKRIGVRKPKGRPLPGTRRSGLRKRMDGTVERWK